MVHWPHVQLPGVPSRVMETCFSSGALTIVTALLGIMSGAVSLLFRLLLSSKQAQIDELTRLTRRQVDIGQRTIEHVERER